MLRGLLNVGRKIAKLEVSRNSSGLNHKFIFQQSRYLSVDLKHDWPDNIKTYLAKRDIVKLTPIQEKTLPIITQKKNLVGIARTGSGKTLAFAIPAVMKILEEREAGSSEKKVTCLVLCPTRELANQTGGVFEGFKSMGISTAILVGGNSRDEQIRKLRGSQLDVYIATPGRLQDLIESGIADVSNVRFLVIDEADRMLDMGFQPQLRNIVKSLPDDRQTVMWSATWPSEVEELAFTFMPEYERVAVDSETLKANPNIEQKFDICRPNDKIDRLLHHIEKLEIDFGKNMRCVIFVNRKRQANYLLSKLRQERHRSVLLHGDLSQNQREQSMRLFRDRYCGIMIASDVAARGLDIDDINCVINFDMPTNIEDYVHRIGRTARHEKKGLSITLFTEEDASIATKVIKMLRETKQEIPDQLREMEVSIGRFQPSRPTFRSPHRGGYRGKRDFQAYNYDDDYHRNTGYNSSPRNRSYEGMKKTENFEESQEISMSER